MQVLADLLESLPVWIYGIAGGVLLIALVVLVVFVPRQRFKKRLVKVACDPELAAKASGFRWLRGEELVSTYEAPRLREPPPFRKAFCKRCGSPLPVLRESTFTS